MVYKPQIANIDITMAYNTYTHTYTRQIYNSIIVYIYIVKKNKCASSSWSIFQTHTFVGECKHLLKAQYLRLGKK